MPNPFSDPSAPPRAAAKAGLLRRRDFLRGSLATGLLLSSASLLAAEKALTSLRQRDPWLTLDSVQQQLLPSDGNGPGARELNALSYLYAVTEQPQLDADSKQFIFDGVGWLNDLAKQHHQRPFSQLNDQQQRQLIDTVNRSQAGQNWLANQLNYLFEALLSSPVYGGNVDQQGWRWLQHSGGFPQPDPAHTWYQLERRR
ncbi:gluconate 2-dehydrogenase gamma chain [Sinobacterium caligoides]|uniref:Gluconate 2-dehydrogenase gamma chain n=1 Tax=Sinobacterium caligoides TaxID=933926 RepID=A0A3N2E0J6_9GAMM|nr:gluconate 2-dehydrogenase subunit 3 family protein [Sinobacterium caligoides]ROS05630.1 gluconate 2-dehydrogenase gamma chain [Sinobacterium caligoides]